MRCLSRPWKQIFIGQKEGHEVTHKGSQSKGRVLNSLINQVRKEQQAHLQGIKSCSCRHECGMHLKCLGTRSVSKHCDVDTTDKKRKNPSMETYAGGPNVPIMKTQKYVIFSLKKTDSDNK